jgi:flagellar protein FliO/FliZ
MRLIPLGQRLIAGLPLLFFNCLVLAADGGAHSMVRPEGEKAPFSALSSSQDPIAMTSLWQLTLGMLLVLSLILAIAWMLKRSGRFQVGAGGGLRILGGLSMGSRERVVLIQAGETQLLLGVAPGRVQTLHVLERPLQPQRAASGSGFAEQLGHLITKDKKS